MHEVLTNFTINLWTVGPTVAIATHCRTKNRCWCLIQHALFCRQIKRNLKVKWRKKGCGQGLTADNQRNEFTQNLHFHYIAFPCYFFIKSNAVFFSFNKMEMSDEVFTDGRVEENFRWGTDWIQRDCEALQTLTRYKIVKTLVGYFSSLIVCLHFHSSEITCREEIRSSC